MEILKNDAQQFYLYQFALGFVATSPKLKHVKPIKELIRRLKDITDAICYVVSAGLNIRNMRKM